MPKNVNKKRGFYSDVVFYICILVLLRARCAFYQIEVTIFFANCKFVFYFLLLFWVPARMNFMRSASVSVGPVAGVLNASVRESCVSRRTKSSVLRRTCICCARSLVFPAPAMISRDNLRSQNAARSRTYLDFDKKNLKN